jgi:hypothetical protein
MNLAAGPARARAAAADAPGTRVRRLTLLVRGGPESVP